MKTVLGVDLASGRWRDNGTALIQFTNNNWESCNANVIHWPNLGLTSTELASVIDRLAVKEKVFAVCIDGPQGWREPNPIPRNGVGRWCEWLTKTQGKTGRYGNSYPMNQLSWIRFSIDVFEHLISLGNAQLIDNENNDIDSLPDGKYHLIEVFPTATWKNSNLQPLPGKQRCRDLNVIQMYKNQLALAYHMPKDFLPTIVGHDDLQAIVATLSAVGLCSELVESEAMGMPPLVLPANNLTPIHRCEGYIWIARPNVNNPMNNNEIEIQDNSPPSADREGATVETIRRGIKLFHYLIKVNQLDECIGVGYADFIAIIHGERSFIAVNGTPFNQTHIKWVLEIARHITDESGGPFTLTRDETTIYVGMDSFIWPVNNNHRLAEEAFADHLENYNYTSEEWELVFPNNTRRLINIPEALEITE